MLKKYNIYICKFILEREFEIFLKYLNYFRNLFEGELFKKQLLIFINKIKIQDDYLGCLIIQYKQDIVKCQDLQ